MGLVSSGDHQSAGNKENTHTAMNAMYSINIIRIIYSQVVSIHADRCHYKGQRRDISLDLECQTRGASIGVGL